jgi:putative acetyltransferase
MRTCSKGGSEFNGRRRGGIPVQRLGGRRADGPVPEFRIRDTLGVDEYPRLVEIWRSAVDATHDFLADDDRAEIEARLSAEYLPHVRLIVAEINGHPVGFAGTSADKLEMLFVDAVQRGRGVGSRLLSHVVGDHGVTCVDVNEENVQAVDFYSRRGFVVSGRSELDDAGRPYPLLHMSKP